MSLRRRLPDLLILDGALTVHVIHEVVRLARTRGDGRRPLVLAVVGDFTDASLRRLLSTEIDDILRAPVQPWEIDARLLLIQRRDAPPARLSPAHLSVPTTPEAVSGREVLLEDLDRRVSACRRGQAGAPALVVCRVERLGQVNIALGHETGDELLRAVTERVSEASAPDDLVTRLDGATIAVVTETRSDVREATDLADAVRRSLERATRIGHEDIFPAVSIGVARWTNRAQNPPRLLRQALAALHHARGPAGARHAVYREGMEEAARAMLELENDLRRALLRRELEVHYQPIVTLRGGRIAGFEALARWRHPTRGLQPPATFIPAAETLGLIIHIDRWVVEAACQQLRSWQVRYRTTPPLCINVNVSSSQFMQPDLVPQLDLILRSTGVWGQSVGLEVTESVLMEDAQHAAAMLAQLRRLGMGISVDDFGTGYSSLAYLRRFEIDAIKIDRSFVARMLVDEDSMEIVRSVVQLARNLGKVTIAEGVETRSQLEALRGLDVDQIQGMFVAPALTPEAAETLLASTAAAEDQLEHILNGRLAPSRPGTRGTDPPAGR